MLSRLKRQQKRRVEACFSLAIAQVNKSYPPAEVGRDVHIVLRDAAVEFLMDAAVKYNRKMKNHKGIHPTFRAFAIDYITERLKWKFRDILRRQESETPTEDVYELELLDEEVADNYDAVTLAILMEDLSEPDKMLICWRFGIGCERLQVKDIADRLGIGRTKVYEQTEAVFEQMRTNAFWAKIKWEPR